MFLIFGIDQRRNQGVTLKDGAGESYLLYLTYTCFSLFFIPLFRWGKIHYLETAGVARSIPKEDYDAMRQSGRVLDRYVVHPEPQQATSPKRDCVNEYCPVCKQKLEKGFSYCPYCGQKQPTQ